MARLYALVERDGNLTRGADTRGLVGGNGARHDGSGSVGHCRSLADDEDVADTTFGVGGVVQSVELHVIGVLV